MSSIRPAVPALFSDAVESARGRLVGSPLGGLLPGEKVVDLFCGAGGWGEGAKLLGIPVDFAVNHWSVAIDTHRSNNPETRHHLGDAWRARPLEVVGGAGVKVGLLLASAACTTHSRARGSAPVSKRVHMLGWCIARWMREVSPRLVLIENVPEWRDWGPLVPKRDERGRAVKDAQGRAVMVQDPARKGKHYRALLRYMRKLGYAVEEFVCDAPDFGEASRRRRLFIQARRDTRTHRSSTMSAMMCETVRIKAGALRAWPLVGRVAEQRGGAAPRKKRKRGGGGDVAGVLPGNSRVVATCAEERRDGEGRRASGQPGAIELLETMDAHDRAHLEWDPCGGLRPARLVPSARPRKYPACLMTGCAVTRPERGANGIMRERVERVHLQSFESTFEQVAELAQRLGVGTRRTMAEARNDDLWKWAARERLSPAQVRDRLRRPTYVRDGESGELVREGVEGEEITRAEKRAWAREFGWKSPRGSAPRGEMA